MIFVETSTESEEKALKRAEEKKERDTFANPEVSLKARDHVFCGPIKEGKGCQVIPDILYKLL